MKSKSPLKIIFFEVNLSNPSPLLTLDSALKRMGAISKFIDINQCSTSELVKSAIEYDIGIYQGYSKAGSYTHRQLGLCALLGLPLIRNWAGSDALNVYSDHDIATDTKNLDRLISLNLSTTHKGIIKELEERDVKTTLTPQLIDNLSPNLAQTKFSKSGVLAYLPSFRRDFYGAKYIEHAIKKYSQLTFYILADEKTSYSQYDNVINLGWRKELDDIWGSVGLLIRLTDHDGYPRMILEAQARKKYVIHNNQLPGVIFASDIKTLDETLDQYLLVDAPNAQGLSVFNDHLSSLPDERLYNTVLNVTPTLKQRLAGLLAFLNNFRT